MLFFTEEIRNGICCLDQEESGHCIKVLRKRVGDLIDVTDGKGSLYKCRLTDDSPKNAAAEIIERVNGWGGHPYALTMAVCPTKNNDRYEWFAEKGTEFGLDTIVPVIGERSERRVFKGERLKRIVLSAAKQSLKGVIPEVCEPETVRDFICRNRENKGLKLICYCFEDETLPRISIKEALKTNLQEQEGCFDSVYTEGREDAFASVSEKPEIIILVGPEGDFSEQEAAAALDCGFIPVHLGASRLRTETAALAAVSAVYFHFSK